MSENLKKANDLMAEAEKMLNGGKSFFGGLFGTSKTSDAVEKYLRAGNLYKMEKKWSEAGSAFHKAAEIHLKSEQNKHDAATCFVDSSTCYKKTDSKESIANLSSAIELYQEMGRFSIAAKHTQTIAEILESSGDLAESIIYYEKAADMFKGEESNAAANKALLKVAAHAAITMDYNKAIKVYEEIATTSLDSSLLKYSAKEYFFRAGICHLCVDFLNATTALNKYAEMYPAFADTREFKLIKSLCTFVEEEDVEGWGEGVAEFDSVSRLDPWTTTLLLRVKKSMEKINENDLC